MIRAIQHHQDATHQSLCRRIRASRAWYLCLERVSLAAKQMLFFFLARSDLVLVSERFKRNTGLSEDPLETLSGSDCHATLVDSWLHNEKCRKVLQQSTSSSECWRWDTRQPKRLVRLPGRVWWDTATLASLDMIRSVQMWGNFDQRHDLLIPFEPNYGQLNSELVLSNYMNFIEFHWSFDERTTMTRSQKL